MTQGRWGPDCSFKSSVALHDFIVNKEWGGRKSREAQTTAGPPDTALTSTDWYGCPAVIDAKQFGIDGTEPESTKVLRLFFQQQEPELFDWVMHQGDPMVRTPQPTRSAASHGLSLPRCATLEADVTSLACDWTDQEVHHEPHSGVRGGQAPFGRASWCFSGLRYRGRAGRPDHTPPPHDKTPAVPLCEGPWQMSGNRSGNS